MAVILYGSWIYNYLLNQCLSPLMLWVRISIRATCITLCDKVCQWLPTGFSAVSSTNTTDRHDLTEILLKVALNTIKQRNKHNILPFIFLFVNSVLIAAPRTQPAELPSTSMVVDWRFPLDWRGCQVVIWKALPWTIASTMFWEFH
jgi:hypothetical protein